MTNLLKSFWFKKVAQLGLHILFWGGVLFFYTYYFGFGTNDIQYVLSFSLFLMPITIGITYFMIYKLLPDYFLQKKYWKFGIYTIYTLIISSYLILLSVFAALIYLSGFKVREMSPISRDIVFVMIGVYLIVIMVSAFKLLKLNSNSSLKNAKLEKKIAETQFLLKEQELNYLKMQIHPHFLFNTLNSLYAFALKKSDFMPELIIKLSNLLDYLLYQTNKPTVSLLEEIKHLEDYIDLEKMRFGNTLELTFLKENIDNHFRIAPMLLLPFVENSFKHGSLSNGKKLVDIKLKCEKGILQFQIENSAKPSSSLAEGIGLRNIKKRLEMLYADEYQLVIQHKDESYKIELQINSQIRNA